MSTIKRIVLENFLSFKYNTTIDIKDNFSSIIGNKTGEYIYFVFLISRVGRNFFSII